MSTQLELESVGLLCAQDHKRPDFTLSLASSGVFSVNISWPYTVCPPSAGPWVEIDYPQLPGC